VGASPQRPPSRSQGKPKSAGTVRQHLSAGSSRFQLSGSLSVADHKELPPNQAMPPMMRIFTTMCADKGTMTDLPVELDDDASIGEETVSLTALSMASGSVDREKFVQNKRKEVIYATKSFRNNTNMENSPSSTTLPSQDALILSLQNSPNPLATLHQYYWKYIPSVFRARLLSTSVVSAKFVSEKNALDLLFSSVRMELEKIEFCLKVGLRGIEKCTELTLSLVAVGDVERLDEKFRNLMSKVLKYVRYLIFFPHITHSFSLKLFRNMAELEVTVLWCDIQLNEFRFIFEKLRKMGILNLAEMIRDSEPYSMSHIKFAQSEKALVS
jgi:hypothetical protein